MFFLLASFLLYGLDVGLDVWVAVEYYIADREDTDPYARHYLAATLFFVIVPCFIINFVSWALYAWGWLIYRGSKRLHGYCCQRLEQMRYVRQCGCTEGEGQARDQVVLVDGVHVIRWMGGGGGGGGVSTSLERRRKKSPRHFPSSSPSRAGAGGGAMVLNAVPSRHSMVGGHTRKGSQVPILSDTDPTATETDLDQEVGTEETDTGLEFYPLDLFDSCEFFAVTLLHMFLLGYLFRAIRLLYMRKRDKYSFDRYRDLSFLRLVEAFLESAPQLVLQLYLLVVHQEAVLWYKIVTPISIGFSVLSLSLAVGDYISADKDVNHYDPHPTEERRPRLSWPGYITIIVWHLCLIVARGLAFSLFATVYGAYVFLIAGLHYLAMVYWMYWQQARVFRHDPAAGRDRDRDLCTPRQVAWRQWVCPCWHQLCANYGIELVAAAFNVFFHFKIRDGGTIVTLVPFYLLFFVENAIMILLWYFGRDQAETIWYGVPALVVVFVGFFVGMGLLVCYYLWCQPSRKPSLEPDETLNHPTLTVSLNRMYQIKRRKGNFFKRTCNSCYNSCHHKS